MCLLLLLLLLLLLQDDDSSDDGGLSSSWDDDEKPCDPSKETTTAQIAIKWSDRPSSYKGFFERKDIELTWAFDWPDNWSVFEAEDVEPANAIMTDILASIEGADMYGSGPMGYPETNEALKAHVEGVFGSCPAYDTAAKPAAVPAECSPNSCPNPGLWGLNRIRAPAVWSALPGEVNANPSAPVMVIDSGIRTTHRDLNGNLVANLVVTAVESDGAGGFRAIPPVRTSLTTPPANVALLGHGTHVAGTVYALWSNGGQESPVGVVGRALGGSCGCRTTGSSQDGFCHINCFNYATNNGVRVINLSFGGVRPTTGGAETDAQRDALRRFCEAGGIAVIAAGNSGVNIIRPNAWSYPAAFATEFATTHPTCIIAVANLQENGVLAQSSNFGTNVVVAAPGTGIFSSFNRNDADTEVLSGTSMAAPHVAGMATLLFNAFPGATQREVYNCIVSTATRPATPNPNTPGQQISGGIVDLEAAYSCMRANPTCPTTGLPACVLPNSGQPVQTCDTTRFCRPIPNNSRFACQYSYRPENSVCPLPTTTPANQKVTCGQCRATVCVEASKKFCKTANKNARQAASLAEIEGNAAATDSSATVRTSV